MRLEKSIWLIGFGYGVLGAGASGTDEADMQAVCLEDGKVETWGKATVLNINGAGPVAGNQISPGLTRTRA
ncbi:hypothetical protein F5Y00DRAFT_233569 [Daldinia vernicosa]|uniref:uncharacterized protein n=1 Tax=Daldinia vernicosa TaxID=114800 RepID=UPI002008D9A1|nr:uncharacterized protein F5Y00DRAFT_233569 [Daldinia vernicosa]KAI0850089.1 hypothetical protein F5Y00DRAFT_233569 [Daldinia vernicosa]